MTPSTTPDARSRQRRRRRRRARHRALVAAIGVVIASVAVAAALRADGDSADGTDTSTRTAHFETLDGTPVALASYRGEPLVVNFFAVSCAECLVEMAELETVHQEFGDQVQFLGLDVQDPPATVRAVVRDAAVTYEIGRDAHGALLQAIGGVAVPSTVLIHRDGRIVDIHAGPLTAPQLRAKIRDLLQRRST